MAMVKCKNCDNEVMNTAVLCSSCGSPQANTQSKIVRYGGDSSGDEGNDPEWTV